MDTSVSTYLEENCELMLIILQSSMTVLCSITELKTFANS
jgi:hypothetical protein